MHRFYGMVWRNLPPKENVQFKGQFSQTVVVHHEWVKWTNKLFYKVNGCEMLNSSHQLYSQYTIKTVYSTIMDGSSPVGMCISTMLVHMVGSVQVLFSQELGWEHRTTQELGCWCLTFTLHLTQSLKAWCVMDCVPKAEHLDLTL